MRGVFTKIMHEIWLATLLFGLGLFAVIMLLTFLLPQIYEGIGQVINRLALARNFLTVLLGTDVRDSITAQTMQAFLWVHPTVLVLVWAHEVGLCTRWPAAEIDRGTIDVLLSWPVSRRAVFLCETMAWLASGVLILAMGLVGHLILAPGMPDELRPRLSRVWLVLANLYCVYIAVGGIAFLVSACSDRRGRAIGVVFTILLASFLLNFVANIWPPARHVAFLGVLEYYRPAQILQNGEVLVSDIAVLLAVGGVSWLLAGEVVARRSICTV